MACQYLEKIKGFSVKREEPKRILAFRCIGNNGEFSDEWAIELLFRNKYEMESYARNNRLSYQEITDNEALPFSE